MNDPLHGHEVRREIHIDAAPATAYALLTDAKQMMTWLADVVEADPRPGGRFRLSEPGGACVEGSYIVAIAGKKVSFTWGGVQGLAPGQSTVELLLDADGDGTLLKLRHFGLPESAAGSHERGWKISGLLKLKAMAEGRDPGGTCLGHMAHIPAGAA